MRAPTHPAVVTALTDPNLPARLWADVDVQGDLPPGAERLAGPNVAGEVTPCWLWTGKRDKDGFGTLSLRSQPIGAARLAVCFGEANGRPRLTPPAQREYPLGGIVRTTCGRRDCIRPSHLRVAVSEDAERLMRDRFGFTTVTLEELPATHGVLAPRRAPAGQAKRPRTPRLAPAPRGPDIHPPASSLAPGSATLPDGRTLTVAVATTFRSGSVLLWTEWGAFDGATVALALAAAVAGHPDAGDPADARADAA